LPGICVLFSGNIDEFNRKWLFCNNISVILTIRSLLISSVFFKDLYILVRNNHDIVLFDFLTIT